MVVEHHFRFLGNNTYDKTFASTFGIKLRAVYESLDKLNIILFTACNIEVGLLGHSDSFHVNSTNLAICSHMTVSDLVPKISICSCTQ